MDKWFNSIIFQIILLCSHSYANTVSDPSLPADGDIPQTLLPALDPVETGNYWKIILFWAIVVIFLIFVLFLFLRKRQPLTAPLSSFQQFLRDLHRAKLHVYTQDTREFCSALCFALKSYVQREYQLPITCRTTEEFLRLVNNSTKFSWEIASDLTDILQYSDQAKFAGKIFHQDFHKDLFLKTCRFAREVRRIRASKKITVKSSPKQ
jgi:hypothetical protein